MAHNDRPAVPRKWALAIGVDYYVKYHSLRGCVNDVNDMKLYLESKYPGIDITMLRAVPPQNPEHTFPEGPKRSWPTLQNLIKAFDRITEQARKGDFVYIHYSGHGTRRQTKGLPYRTMEHYDAALVLFDENAVGMFRYLRGIHLAQYLDRMVSKGLIVTIVLDCCCSGGVTRGDHRVRSVDWVEQDKNQSDLVQYLSSQSPGTTLRDGCVSHHWLLRPQNYTLLAACESFQTASEIKYADERWNGILTRTLLQVLADNGPNRPDGHKASLGRIHRQILPRIPMYWQQTPAILGNTTARFLGSEDRDTDKEISCRVSFLSEKMIRLQHGRIHGVCINDEYEVYSDQLRNEGKPSRKLGRVIAVADWESEAKMIKLDKIDLREPDWRARSVSHHPDKVAVTLRANGPHRAWVQAVTKSLWLCTPKITPRVPPKYVVVLDAHGQCKISGGLANSLIRVPTIDWNRSGSTASAIDVLEHMAKFERIEGLRPRDPDFIDGIDFDIRIGGASNPNENPQITDGQSVQFVFRNLSNRTLHFIVLNLTPLGRIHRLYPKPKDGGRSKSVEAEQSVLLQPRMTIPIELQGKKQRITDVLKFFVSDDPELCLDPLTLPELERYLYSKRGSSELLECLRRLGADRDASSEDEQERKNSKWGTQSIYVHTIAKGLHH